MSQKTAKLAITICAAVLLISLLTLSILELSPLSGGQKLSVQDNAATLYDGQADFGVVLLAKERSDATALVRALQALDAPMLYMSDIGDIEGVVEEFTKITQIPKEKIVVATVGDYAREGLLYASTAFEGLGAAFIRPTVDVDALLNNGIYSCALLRLPMLVAGHAGDAARQDILNVKLYNLISGDTIEPNGRPVNANRGITTLKLAPAAISSDAMMSSSLLDAVVSWTAGQGGIGVPSKSVAPVLKAALWFVAVVSLLAGLFLISVNCRAYYYPDASGVVAAEVKNRWLFYLSRAVLWIAALPLTLGIWIIMLVIKAPLGVGGSIFISYFIGCSITTGLLYRFGMLGIKGTPNDIKPVRTTKGIVYSLLLWTVVIATGVVLAMSGMWGITLTQSRLILFGILAVVLYVGMLSVMHDALMLGKAAHSEGIIAALLLIPYLPLVALAVLFIPMGQLYVTIALVKLLSWLIIAIVTAKITRELTGAVAIAAVIGSVVFSLFAAFQIYL